MTYAELLTQYGPAMGGGIIFLILLVRGDIVTRREFIAAQTQAKDAVAKAEELAKDLAAKQDAERAQLVESLNQASKEREQLLATVKVLLERSNVPGSVT